MYQSANNYILMYIHEHAVELSQCVPCLCAYLPTVICMNMYIFMFFVMYTYQSRGGGLGSSTIFKKFNEPYAPS